LIEKIVDLALTPFKKGAPFEKFYPAVQAIETIVLTPKDVTPANGPHIRDAVDLKRFMIMVVIAIMPCTLFGIYNTGYQTLAATGGDAENIALCFFHGMTRFLPLYVVTLAAGGTVEMIFAVIRKHEINEGFLVSSMLFPLILPPTLPLWMAAVGIIFGVIFGKEVFGGTGMNIFNPALTGRCFLFFAYAPEMSGDKVWIAPQHFMTYPPIDWGDSIKNVDVITQATPLSSAVNGTLFNETSQGGYTFLQMFLGNVPGSIGETSALCALIGAILLIVFRIGSYKTMIGTVIGCLATAFLFNLAAPHIEDANPILKVPFYYHLVMGGFAFGAVYMATDPVSGPSTGLGKWIYGILIGVIVVLIRNINPAYPEGMMLAILFMNLFAPLIDHYVMEARIKRRLARV
jgi:Na+-transporting NADH:ubiquinone oxidoreductase subunit B